MNPALLRLFGCWAIGVVAMLTVIALLRRPARRRRTGVPGERTVANVVLAALIGLVGCSCGNLVFGGPELRREVTRQVRLFHATQPVSATVESHRCRPSLAVRTLLVYRFSAPDPATGQPRTYRRTEGISESRNQCSPIAPPYTRTIWYDPANPERATAQPLRIIDMLAPMLLLTVVGGCFGALPLYGAVMGIIALRRRTPAEKQRAADVRLMESQGFLIVIEHDLIHATAAARANPALRPYVRAYHGQQYLSLDFMADPDVRLATWNALWKVQNGTSDTEDRDLVTHLMDQLRGKPNGR